MKPKARWLLASLVVLAVLAMAAQTLAQGGRGPRHAPGLVLVGTVEAIDTDTITVDGNVINTAMARIEDTITVGVTVTVYYVVASDDTWVALEVKLGEDTLTEPPEMTDFPTEEPTEDVSETHVPPPTRDASETHAPPMDDHHGTPPPHPTTVPTEVTVTATEATDTSTATSVPSTPEPPADHHQGSQPGNPGQPGGGGDHGGRGGHG